MSNKKEMKDKFNWQDFGEKLWNPTKKHWWKFLLIILVLSYLFFEFRYLYKNDQLFLENSQRAVTILREALVIFATLYGIFQAKQWIRELRGRDQYEIARKLSVQVERITNILITLLKGSDWLENTDENYGHKFQSSLKDFIDDRGKDPKKEEAELLHDQIYYKSHIKLAQKYYSQIEALLPEAKALKMDVELEVNSATKTYLTIINNDIATVFRQVSDYGQYMNTNPDFIVQAREFLGMAEDKESPDEFLPYKYKKISSPYISIIENNKKICLEKLAFYME